MAFTALLGKLAQRLIPVRAAPAPPLPAQNHAVTPLRPTMTPLGWGRPGGPLAAGEQEHSMHCNCFVDSELLSRERPPSVWTRTRPETLWYCSTCGLCCLSDVMRHVSESRRDSVYFLPIKHFNQFYCLGHFCWALNEGKKKSLSLGVVSSPLSKQRSTKSTRCGAEMVPVQNAWPVGSLWTERVPSARRVSPEHGHRPRSDAITPRPPPPS